MPAGSFAGRDGRGPYDAGDQVAMAAIVEATRNRAGSTELVVDYDHQTVFASIPGVGGRAPAAGWLKELDVRANGIWGRVVWTAAAAQAIRAGEYRYISPVYHHDAAGKVLLLLSAGLTNSPNLDLAAVAASALPLTTEGDDMKKIAEALGLAADASETAILAAIGTITAAQSAIATAAGLATGATADAVVTAVQSARAAVPDPTRYVPVAQVAAMQAEFKTLRDTVVGDKAAAAVDGAIAEGKLAPALKDWALAYAKADLGNFQAFIAAAPVIVTPGGRPMPQRQAADVALDDSDRAVMRAMGISEVDMLTAKKKQQETV
ncbi:MAG TPA: phage protease [Xanthobacteraceae bacterium]|nr:phage protease [Xanthobacteraceae bacterium]